jgi:hypothetical protein
MSEFDFFKKRDLINAKDILIKIGDDSCDLIILEISQNYTNSLLKTLNLDTIQSVFNDVIESTMASISAVKNRVKSIIYSLEIERTPIPEIDMVIFRFLFVGKSLNGLECYLRKKISPLVKNEIGGELLVIHKVNQTELDLFIELMPIRNLQYLKPPKSSTLRTYYSNELYRKLMDVPKDYPIKINH